MNLIIETFGESVDFYYYTQSQENATKKISAGWMVDGFILEDEGSEDTNSWFYYENEEGSCIYGLYLFAEAQVLSIDTEDAEVSKMRINGIDAIVVQKEDRIQIAWGTEGTSGFINLVGYGIKLEDMIHIAEQLHY